MLENAHGGPAQVVKQQPGMTDSYSSGAPLFAKRLVESALAAFSVRLLEEWRSRRTARRRFRETEKPWADDVGTLQSSAN
ncbi:MAG TPA: hypothetical protein VIW95_06675 [Candidatus Binatus sp.]